MMAENILHMPTSRKAPNIHISSEQFHETGVAQNSVLINESYLYLNSDNSTKKNDTFEFQLNPSISSDRLERTYVYLKSFSAVNNLQQIDSTQFHILRSDSSQPYIRSFAEGSFSSPEELCLALNEKFCPLNGDTFVNTIGDIDEGKAVPFIKFTYDDTSCLITAKSTKVDSNTGNLYNFDFQGKIFDLLKLEGVAIIENSYTSTEPIDIDRNISDVYISCAQLSDHYSIGVNNNIQSVLSKIPVRTNYGGYIHFTKTLPIQPRELHSKNISKLSFKFLDNDGYIWSSLNRFNITICIQKRQPVVRERETYWQEDGFQKYLEAEQLSKKPPLFAPNSKCPSFPKF